MERNNKTSDLSDEKIRLLRERLTDKDYIKSAIDKIAEDVSVVIINENKKNK